MQEVSADQWGLFTTAQAKQQGIIGTELSRAAQAGQIEPITHGVYRLAGVPSDEFDGIRAAWLSTDPKRPAYERLNDEDPVVVSGSSAAWLHGIGDLQPSLTSSVRQLVDKPADQTSVSDGAMCHLNSGPCRRAYRSLRLNRPLPI
ncbi:type IV toxin-antitoxin system AbiEi family antitoxin domain-containing protein [Kocuria atrinae]|uniref:type IV toxin-antitoxin system AbiEi family antitoxin domain-containing protein n=1 Tax=Kocuria atrinae TaxID=592377 RepID=UPI0021D42C8C|nr:type IV toxin-antitoxin system AbiEi family antitoxin domain-containing protein [Kocuria atrinae]